MSTKNSSERDNGVGQQDIDRIREVVVQCKDLFLREYKFIGKDDALNRDNLIRFVRAGTTSIINQHLVMLNLIDLYSPLISIHFNLTQNVLLFEVRLERLCGCSEDEIRLITCVESTDEL